MKKIKIIIGAALLVGALVVGVSFTKGDNLAGGPTGGIKPAPTDFTYEISGS